MAFIIQQTEQFRFNYATYYHNNLSFNQSIQEQIKRNPVFIKENFVRGVGKLQNFSLNIGENLQQIVVRYVVNRIYKNMSLLFTVLVNRKTEQIRIKSKVVNITNGFAKVEGQERRKLITKYLCNRASLSFGLCKISLNVETGQLKFQSPFYYLQSITSYHSLQSLLQFLTRVNTQNIRDYYEQVLSILFLTEQQFGSLYNDIQNKLLDKKTIKIYRYFLFSNVFLNLASETQNEQQDLNLNLRKQAESFQKLKENYVNIDQNFSSLILFSDVDLKILHKCKQKSDQSLNLQQRTHISQRLQLPSNQKSNIPNQNFFVLNYIKVNKKISETTKKKIKTGGFTTIYLSQIEYWYVGSYCVGVVQDLQENDTPPLKKYIIIKREDQNLAKLSGKSRVAHERFILTKIKCGISMFLPKYYLLAEKDNSFQKDLLVDYISSPNLRDYIDKNRVTLSLSTKIYFILLIGQALRYLKEYKIAHLDLKPSNIMTHRRLTLKLIDFGESYHPELLKSHQPGFSMPYSAPQNYCYMDSYNSKNDVFSLGVIMYEFFIGKYPFYLYNEKLRDKVYTSGTYLDYWYETPEEMLMFGEPVICPIIHSIMARCLHPDPDHRPELEWIVLIFRECLEYFS